MKSQPFCKCGWRCSDAHSFHWQLLASGGSPLQIVQEVGRLLDLPLAALVSLNGADTFLAIPCVPATRTPIPGARVQLREREVIADLRQGDHAVLLLEVVEQRFQVST